MTDEFEEIFEALPIFPLSVVLFPREILPLHIFEERYKQMIKYALDHGAVFGLSYEAAAAVDHQSPPSIGSVGTAAKVNAVMPLDEGRMNIVSTGLVRYRVAGLSQREPFIIARVDAFADDEIEDDFQELFEEVSHASERFIAAARALDELGPLPDELPEDPEDFSLFVSSLLPIQSDSKQRLLEMTSTRTRLSRLRRYLASAIGDYETRLKITEAARKNGHGKLPKEVDHA